MVVEAAAVAAAGDLVGVDLPAGPRVAVVLRHRGQRTELRAGCDQRTLLIARRDLTPLAALPATWLDRPLPQSCSDPPWQISEQSLGQTAPRRRELAAAWLLVRESGQRLSLAELVDLIGDSADPAQRAACWLWLQGGQTLFRWRQQHCEARPPEELRRLRQQRRRDQLLARQHQLWRDQLRSRRPIQAEGLSPEQRQDLALLRERAGGDSEIPLPEALQRLLQEIHCPADPGAIRHLLVDLGQWERHHLPSLQASPWQQGFSPELLAEADRLAAAAGDPWPGDDSRLDLREQRVITIDDEDTLEIDDGLAIEWRDGQARLWIHIADPGRLVPSGSPLDREAARRATSLYLARGTLPMFPPQLAHGAMSLRAGCRSAALSLWVELDAQGAVQAEGLHRSWIRPAYRLSYADADALLELAPPQERDLLTLADQLARRQRWRLERGALQLDDPEGRIRARGGLPQASDGQQPASCGMEDPPAVLDVIEPSPARRMVAEAMVLAGAVLADRARRAALPLPYRSQPICALPPAAELSLLPPGPVRHAAIKRCLSRGVVGTSPEPHFSLGLPAYVQATSPIRRYADLLVQRQLICLLEGRPPLSVGELSEHLQDLEGPLRQSLQIQREDQRHWLQVWFEQQPRHPLAGLFLRWLRADQQLGLVWLEDLCQTLPCHCPPRAEPGMRLLIRVVEVDALRDRLRLEASS